jgi:hypothetical protein
MPRVNVTGTNLSLLRALYWAISLSISAMTVASVCWMASSPPKMAIYARQRERRGDNTRYSRKHGTNAT